MASAKVPTSPPATPVRTPLPAKRKSPGRPKKVKKKARPDFQRSSPNAMKVLAEPDSEDETVDPRDPTPSPKPSLEEILETAENLSSMLSAFGDTHDLIESFKEHGSSNEELIKRLQLQCSTIGKILEPQTAIMRRPQALPTISRTQLPDNAELYGNPYVFRAPSNYIMILRVEEVFRGNTNYNRKKVVAWVQRKGGWPLAYALPGWTICADSHPKLLDSCVWTDLVKHFGKYHGHDFKRWVFDTALGQEAGHTLASHVEPKLMLHFAVTMLAKKSISRFEDIDWTSRKVLEKLIGELWRLKDWFPNLEAELYLTESPCVQCHKFRRLIESYTGIKFHLKGPENLGVLQENRNKTGQKGYQLYATYTDDEADDDEEEEAGPEKQIISRGFPRVVIPRSPPTPTTPPASKAEEVVSEVTRESITEKFRYSKSKERLVLSSSSSVTTKLKKRPAEPLDVDSDADEYRPVAPPIRKSRLDFTLPHRKSTRSNGSGPEETDDFGNNNLDKIRKERREQRKREREAGIYPSPPSGKKARRS